MKTYLTGSNPSIRVPVRALTLSNGESLRLYDTSGPYTDPDYVATGSSSVTMSSRAQVGAGASGPSADAR